MSKKPQNLQLSLSSWGLPKTTVEYFQKKGIKELFFWQAECLNQPGVFTDGRNLVFSAPTTAGKSMVADILLFKTALQLKKKVIVVLPFVAITLEKVQTLKQICLQEGIRIDSFTGELNPRGYLDRVDVAVCTLEKANNMINRLIEEKRLCEIGLVIVDELHMLGEPKRGFILELLLSKLLFVQSMNNANASEQCEPINVQIVGMSATISNLSTVASWLDAEHFQTDYRPVQLTQKVVNQCQVYLVNETNRSLSKGNIIQFSDLGIKEDDEAALIFSAIETVVQGFSALVFCATRNQCEELSKKISQNVLNIGRSQVRNGPVKIFGEKLRKSLNSVKTDELCQSLKQTVFGIDPNLQKLIRWGVAFHHAGLTTEERALIENAFRAGTIHILCCTTGLSSGVNLPARRVLISSPIFYSTNGFELISLTTYRQMIGRAGRTGIDDLGESMLFCKNDKEFAEVLTGLVKTDLCPISSSLISFDSEARIELSNSLQRALLEVVANGTVTDYSDLVRYLQCTFFHSSHSDHSNTELNQAIDCVSKTLVSDQLIYQDQNKLTVSSLGKAIVASGVGPTEGKFIYNQLYRARESLSLVTELQLIYLVTSTFVAEQLGKLDWKLFLQLWQHKLTSEEKEVADLVGVEERFLNQRIMNNFSPFKKQSPKDVEKQQIHKRFYLSMALNDLVREMPVNAVASKYGLTKSTVQSLQHQSAMFAGIVTTFCAKLGWHNMVLLVEQFVTRFEFGVQYELIDLMRVNLFNSTIARQLYGKGFESVLSLVNRSAAELESALVSVGPFEKLVKAGRDQLIDPGLNKVFIAKLDQHVTIRRLAQLILQEARAVVESEYGRKLDFNNENSFTQVLTLRLESPSNKGQISENNVQSTSQQATQKSKDSNFTVIKSVKSNMDAILTDSESLDDIHVGKKRKSDSDNLKKVTETVRRGPHSNDDDLFCDSDDSQLQQLMAWPSTSKKSKQTYSGSPVLFDSDDSLMALDEPFTPTWEIQNRSFNDLPENDFSGFDCNSEVSTVKLSGVPVNQDASYSESTFVFSNNPDLSTDFFQTQRLEQIELPSSFDPRLTAKMSIEQYQLVEVQTKAHCRQLLNEVFALTEPNSVLDIAIHFRLVSIESGVPQNRNRRTKTSTGLIINDRYSMELRELNLVRLNSSTVFQIRSNEMFECLQESLKSTLTKLDPFFENSSAASSKSLQKRRFRFLTYDVKKALYLLQFGFHLPLETLMHRIEWHDLSVAIWLLDPETPEFKVDNMSLQELVQLTIQFRLLNSQSFFQRAQKISPKKLKPGRKEPMFVSADDSLLKAASLFHFTGQFCAKLVTDKLYQAYSCIELPARLCLYRLQIAGVRIDYARLRAEQRRMAQYMTHLNDRIVKLTGGKEFNLNSSKAVANVLYDRMNLMSYFDTKKGPNSTAQPKLNSRSTSKVALTKLQNACGKHTIVPNLVMDWRELNHAHQVLSSIKAVLHFDSASDEGLGDEHDLGDAFIYCQCEEWSATGRISLREPNLINVNKDFVCRTITDSVARGLNRLVDYYADSSVSASIVQMRKLITARDGHVLVSADYSQLELRILAHFTKDPTLLATLNQPSGDVFRSIAATWKQLTEEEVTTEQRQQAKQICYGILYGMGNRSLATSLEVTEHEAADFRQSFYQRYTHIQPFVDSVVQSATVNTYVETIGHRRRYIVKLASEESSEKAQGRRQAVNTVIQGSAADVVKLAMVAVDEAIRCSHTDLDAAFVMQMHDELMFEVRLGQERDFARLLKDRMEQVSTHLAVTLPVKVRVGPNWGSLCDLSEFE